MNVWSTMMIDIEGTSVTVVVSDLDQAEEFYQKRLGFSVLYRAGPHFCMMEKAGLQLGLHPGGSASSTRKPGPMSLGLRVSDIHGAVSALEAAGVGFPNGVVDDDGAILRADFADPDGTPLYLVELQGTG